jgi:hypothetical protein
VERERRTLLRYRRGHLQPEQGEATDPFGGRRRMTGTWRTWNQSMSERVNARVKRNRKLRSRGPSCKVIVANRLDNGSSLTNSVL